MEYSTGIQTGSSAYWAGGAEGSGKAGAASDHPDSPSLSSILFLLPGSSGRTSPGSSILTPCPLASDGSRQTETLAEAWEVDRERDQVYILPHLSPLWSFLHDNDSSRSGELLQQQLHDQDLVRNASSWPSGSGGTQQSVF